MGEQRGDGTGGTSGTTRRRPARSIGAGMRLGAASLLAVAAMGVVGACGAVGSVQLTVTTSADGRDADIGDRVCEMTPGAGDCSLRAAIDETNVLPFTTDHIQIAPGVDPTLAIAGTNDDANASGDLDVIGNVTIDGDGATVDGARLDRVFDHRGAGLTLRHLTVTGGEQSGDGEGDEEWDGFPASYVGNGGAGDGAGIASTGALTLIGCTIEHNRLAYISLRPDGSGLGVADAVGAGVAASGGPVRIEGTTIRANESRYGWAGYGGGLAVRDVDDLTLTDSLVRDNVIAGNQLSYQAGGGGIFAERSGVRIERSTIATNRATAADAAGAGGAIRAVDAEVTIVRSTLSGNDGGSDFQPVDGLSAAGGSVTVLASTIVGGPDPAIDAGAGAVVTLTSSIITARCTGAVTSGGWNAGTPLDPFSSVTGCGLAPPTDLVGADLLLGPLVFNGGPTPTHLPGPGSPLLDRIPTGTAGECDGPAQDQRGLPVPVGSGCDVGSVEVQAPVAPPGRW